MTALVVNSLPTRLRTLATRSEAVAAEIHPELTEARAMALQDAADLNEAARVIEVGPGRLRRCWRWLVGRPMTDEEWEDSQW